METTGRYNRKQVFVLLSYLTVCSWFVFGGDAISFYVDNDSQKLKPNGNTDRHYTSGVKLVYLTQPDWNWLSHFSDWDSAEGEDSVDTAVGFFLGQNIYTPDYLEEPQRRSDKDMVFAGWLYTGMFAQRATSDILDHVELSLGVIGPSSEAERAQKCLHKIGHSGDPIGWENQLKDEFAVDLTLMQKRRLTGGWFQPTDNTDVIAEYGLTVGSVHRHAQAGLTFRYGFNLGNTFGPGRLEMPAGISTFRKQAYTQSGYLFARISGRAVEYNRFLTGLDREPLTGQFQLGAVYRYKSLEIGYSQTYYSHEFKEQTGTDSIGTITVSWQF
jgi:hypothetical protein